MPSFSRTDEIEVAADVIVGAGRDLVLMDLLFRAGAVFGVDLLVGAPAKPLLGGSQNDFAPAGALSGIDAGRLHVQRPHFRVAAFPAHHVGVVPLPPGVALVPLVAPTARLISFLTLPLALALPLPARHLQDALPTGPDRERLALFVPLALPLTFAFVAVLVFFAVRIVLRVAGLPLPASALSLSARLADEATEPRHPLRAPLPLLPKLLAEILEPLAQFLPLLVGHFLFGHAVDVFGSLVEVVGREPQLTHDVFGRLREVAIQPIELAARPLLRFVLAL